MWIGLYIDRDKKRLYIILIPCIVIIIQYKKILEEIYSMINNEGFIFPHKWMDTPLQHLAITIWNLCERIGYCPPGNIAPKLFSIIIGKKGKKVK